MPSPQPFAGGDRPPPEERISAPGAERVGSATDAAPAPVPKFLFWLLGGVTVFFLVVTLLQLQSLQRRIDTPPVLDLTSALAPLDEGASSTGDRLMVAQWRTLALLEQNVIERRYHQANVLLMSRTWTRYLGFMTGMIFALVGAAFVMGKLREQESALALKNSAVEANITTTSPGLVLCLLGTVLMLATLLTHHDIETWEGDPLYTRVILAPAAEATDAPLPLPGTVSDPLGDDTAASPPQNP
ncbi:MAG TPA: hypothetical protein VFZ18_08715 [Longimicrobiaceae bacterium]